MKYFVTNHPASKLRDLTSFSALAFSFPGAREEHPLVFATRAVRSAFPHKRWLAAGKFLLRCALHPLVTRDFFAAIENNSSLSRFICHRPRILLKLQRPYLNRAYAPRARLNALLSHYEFADKYFDREFIDKVAGTEGLCLAQVLASDGLSYSIRLTSTDTFDREGELLLSIEQDGERQRVACVAFSITSREHCRQIEIGCLQGARPERGKELVKRATKNFHGVRPKNLLLDALYALAGAWDIDHVMAVGNTDRIFGGSTFACAPVFADYDQFWRELDGVETTGDQFLLPKKLRHRSISEVPSGRRAEYRRRLALREHLSTQIRAQIPVTDSTTSRQRAAIPVRTGAATHNLQGEYSFTPLADMKNALQPM